MKTPQVRKSENMEVCIKSLGFSTKPEVSLPTYLDLIQRIKAELDEVNKYLGYIELGKISYLPSLRSHSIKLQKLFFFFRAVSCALFPPRGHAKNAKSKSKSKQLKKILKQKKSS